jgi:hypothetical protein
LQDAEATWVLPDRSGVHDHIEYWLWVRRRTAVDGDRTTTVRLTRYWCDGAGYCKPTIELDKRISNKAFQIADGLEHARVRFRALGERQRASWRASDDQIRGIGEAGYCGFAGDLVPGERYEGVYRQATTDATLLGRTLRTGKSPRNDSFLGFMVGARTC